MLHGWDFITVHGGGAFDQWVPGENCFLFYKTRALVEEYLDYFTSVRDLKVDTMLELGLYEGGSVPFWLETIEAQRYAGLDIVPRTDSPYFRRYVAERGLEGRVATHWGTSQTDRARLLEIHREDLRGAPIDLVIDDASHAYDETRASFETIFPLVRPGGLYIIEDWAWFHWKGMEARWADHEPLSRFILELVEAVGSSGVRLIRSLEVHSGFAVVQRGTASLEQLEGFRLDDFIYRHPR